MPRLRDLGFFLLCCVYSVVGQDTVKATVYYTASNNSYSIKLDVLDKSGCAYGQFQDTQNSTGWGVLDIKTANEADTVQYHCAGVLEGALTGLRMKETSINVNAYFSKDHTFPSENLKAFVNAQKKWSWTICSKTDLYSSQVCMILHQFQGLVEGAQSVVPDLTELDVYTLNNVGDYFQIIPAVDKSERKDWLNMTHSEFLVAKREFEHCSGLVKVTDDLTNLLWSHSSFFTYANMNRIYKHYYFDVKASVAAKGTSFSSYPGYLESLDDFYLMDSGLAMVQTSNGVYNNSLLDLIKPETLYAWQRVRVANALAHSGKEWYTTFKSFASGTYVNQYMIINFGQFQPGKSLTPGLLWVVEEIPGLVYGGDTTENLQRGYWPSYNKPYWPEVYEKSGYPAVVAKYGPDHSYDLAPRAKMFRRDHPMAHNMEGLKKLMRQNNYQTDPFAANDPDKAICVRGDLMANDPHAGGCYDTKTTELSWAKQMLSHAISGPTTEGLPAFKWISKFASTTHIGQPVNFDFKFVPMQPAKFLYE